MANKNIFVSGNLPVPDAVNSEFAPAYAFSDRHALAQYVATGCFNSTFYASGAEQLERVLKLCREVSPDFIARAAVYSRRDGHMKDMPALLAAVLSVKDRELLERVFDRVIDNGKMLRNFVQIMRSGTVGRRSLGTLPKRLVKNWLEARTDDQLFRDSVGNDPSLADVIKMVHPRPTSASRAALYAYLVGRDYNASDLPRVVVQFERFKKGESRQVPDVPFQMLTSLPLGREEWTEIARRAPWHMTRMNLNTFVRHGVFGKAREVEYRFVPSRILSAVIRAVCGVSYEVKDDDRGREMTELIAARLADPNEVRKAKVFPYQLLAAYVSAQENVPLRLREALQEAMEVAVENVPAVEGKVYVFPDVSGSMSSPVTGFRKGATTAMRCIDVAALVSAAIVRKNPAAEVIPFEQSIVRLTLNPRDSVMTNATRLASIGGGGTNCSAPLAELNRRCAHGDLVVYVSDNESWVDAHRFGSTATMAEWKTFKRRNPNARMVCIDIQPNTTTQAKEHNDILNVGGFSDRVFELIDLFARGELHPDHWVGVIESVKLN